MQTIAERVKSALDSIAQAAQDAGRAADEVKLLAVSKTKPESDIRAAYAAGIRSFGENYVQEGITKIVALADLDGIQWHHIGPLQSNKTQLVADHFDWLQSLDRLKIAERLSRQRSAHKPPLNICIQVNINAEPQKSGVLPEDVEALAATVAELPRLRLRGLMAIPAADQSTEQLQQSFARMHTLFNQIQAQHKQVDTLSMGMSSDMQAAIRAGSTLVRLGTAIFGERHPQSE